VPEAGAAGDEVKPFRASLSVSPYPDGRTWWLNHPITFWRPGSSVRVPAFFETDFASVPAIFQSILPRWDTYGVPSIVHDWLYWNQPCDRKTADRTFLEAMVAIDVQPWKRRVLYVTVRAFGLAAWRSNARIAAEGYSRVKTRASPVLPAWRKLR
jgi:hypothetical protein